MIEKQLISHWDDHKRSDIQALFDEPIQLDDENS